MPVALDTTHMYYSLSPSNLIEFATNSMFTNPCIQFLSNSIPLILLHKMTIDGISMKLQDILLKFACCFGISSKTRQIIPSAAFLPSQAFDLFHLHYRTNDSRSDSIKLSPSFGVCIVDDTELLAIGNVMSINRKDMMFN